MATEKERLRIRRACDTCASSRVRCDGGQPCARCHDCGYACGYTRIVKKRGRKSAWQLAASPTSPASNTHHNRSIDVRPDIVRLRGDSFSGTEPIDPASNLENGTRICERFASAAGFGEPNSTRSQPRASFSEPYNGQHQANDMQSGPRCLMQLYPLLDGIIEPDLARELLELYFVQSQGSFFDRASPYVLTPVLSRDSVLEGYGGRQTTELLLVTIIWIGAHTASLAPLLRPSERRRVCKELKIVLLRLQRYRDPDHWQLDEGKQGGAIVEAPMADRLCTVFDAVENDENAAAHSRRPPLVVDDVLALILITIMISSGDSKIDSIVWWSKAVRLAQRIGLHQIDLPRPLDGTRSIRSDSTAREIPYLEVLRREEERRRVFWLLYSLDRHLSLSFNGTPLLEDGQHFVFTPLPESIWNLISRTDVDVQDIPARQQGPPTIVTGHGYFEYFLPLMTILGDIILFRRQRYHPRFQTMEQYSTSAAIDKMIGLCDKSVNDLFYQGSNGSPENVRSPLMTSPSAVSGSHGHAPSPNIPPAHDTDRLKLVAAYAHFIVLVLQILLHGEWDALVMLGSRAAETTEYQDDRRSDWITSSSFAECSTSTIKASEAISEILEIDPELSFMPYLFGIYLFHGSLLLLLFADRMTDVSGGPIQAVERACETVIRAHEACVVTLNTEFQRVFRRIMRTTLYVVRAREAELRQMNIQAPDQDYAMGDVADSSVQQRLGVNSNAVASMIALRQDLLELYRWNCGGGGLAV